MAYHSKYENELRFIRDELGLTFPNREAPPTRRNLIRLIEDLLEGQLVISKPQLEN